MSLLFLSVVNKFLRMLTRSASVYYLLCIVYLSRSVCCGVIAHNDRARTFRYRTCVFIAHFLSRTWLTLNSVSLFIMQMRETFMRAKDTFALIDDGMQSEENVEFLRRIMTEPHKTKNGYL